MRTGASDGDQIEVLDGIQSGQAVVAIGAGFLGDGDKIRVVEAIAPPAGTDAKAGDRP